MDMKKSHRSILIAVLVPLGMVGGWLGYIQWCWYRVTPPNAVKTLDQFLEWRPRTTAFHKIQIKDGSEFVFARGPSVMPGMLASGPAIYLFDESGRFVDWTGDSGDIPYVNGFVMPNISIPNIITRKEALEFIRK
ncbi:MAG: hypothetical protein O7H41_13490 [Planctomycetota bacterium]|nr:hypothetical protein [Planctomycetota bacterium]